MNKKQLYTAPEAELLVVRFEENIMSNRGVATLVSWIEEGSEDDLDF